jgi:hypothetical protein
MGLNLIFVFRDTNLNRTGTSLIKHIILISVAGAVYLFNTNNRNSFENIKISFGKYIVLGSIIIFTLFHLSNVANFDLRLLPIYLFNLLPIFFLGTVLSFCRLKLGFFYGFFFHAVWNFLPALIYIYK